MGAALDCAVTAKSGRVNQPINRELTSGISAANRALQRQNRRWLSKSAKLNRLC